MGLEPDDHGRLARDILSDLRDSESQQWILHRRQVHSAFGIGCCVGFVVAVLGLAVIWYAGQG